MSEDDLVPGDFESRVKSPRTNADDAFDAFMGMGEQEWSGLLISLMKGGCLQPEERKGFDRAFAIRKLQREERAQAEEQKMREERRVPRDLPEPQSHPIVAATVPSYDEEPSRDTDGLKRLQALVLQMSVLELKALDLETSLETTKKELRAYSENLVPELMSELGMTLMRTAGGAEVELKEDLRASFPKDEGRQAQAFAWLKQTGNDGIIKREITVQYGRDSTEWADKLVLALEAMGVSEHGVVTQEWNIHHQTLLAFLRTEIKAGNPVPMEAFGALVQKVARIKRRK